MELALVSLPPVLIWSLVKKGSVGARTVKNAPPPKSYFLPASAFSCCAPFFSHASLYSSKKLFTVLARFFLAGVGVGFGFAPFFIGGAGGAGVERSTPLSITVPTLIPFITSSAPPI